MWKRTPYADAEAMPSPSDPTVPDTTPSTEARVDGSVPAALRGRYVGVWAHTAGAMVHALELHADGTATYLNRWLTPDVLATNVVTFAGRTLALGRGVLAYELNDHLATSGPVDLAGQSRGIGAHPQLDPHTGALHLVSYGDEPAHHIVAPSSQTRITVPVPEAPGPLHDLLLTHNRFVLLGEGFVGVSDRAGRAPPRWAETDLPGAIAADDLADDVAVLAAHGSLIRWTFDGASTRHGVIDDTPQRFGVTNPQRDGETTYVWTVANAGGTEVYRHDLGSGDRTVHDFGPHRHPGAMTFVPDPRRPHREDGGWLIAFVHHHHTGKADLVVLDAAAIDQTAVVTVRIPQAIPQPLHGTWIPIAE